MTASLIVLGISLIGMMAMIMMKSLALNGRYVPLVTRMSRKADSGLEVVQEKIEQTVQTYRTSALLKFHNFVYDTLIPWMQRKYRGFASFMYRIHRRLWSMLEYSKQSSHKVSEYLKHISHKEHSQG